MRPEQLLLLIVPQVSQTLAEVRQPGKLRIHRQLVLLHQLAPHSAGSLHAQEFGMQQRGKVVQAARRVEIHQVRIVQDQVTFKGETAD